MNKFFPFLKNVLRRPLSLLTLLAALGVLAYAVRQILSGEPYIAALNYIDGTTLVMLALLALIGTASLWPASDLQAVATILVAGLSFIFTYEALFKWSFYLAPFRMAMPPNEFRAFVIQVGTALTVLAGFADGRLALKPVSWALAGVFAAGWVVWLLAGFPQLSGQVILTPPVVPLAFSHAAVYTINRGTKFVLFLVFLSFFPGLRQRKAG